MKRNPLRRLVVALAAVALAGALGATAWAHARDFRAAFVKRMVTARVDAALDAASATDAQRATVHASADRALATLAGELGTDHAADLDRALALFTADTIDADAVAALRAEKLATFARVGDVVTGAIHETFNALSPAQRKSVAAFVRERAGHMHDGAEGRRGGEHHGGHEAMMQHRLGALLDAADASDAQRATIDAAAERFHAVLAEEGRAHRAELDGALAFFTADRWDDAAVAKVRAGHVAAIERIADAATSAIIEAHDALRPEQRRAVAEVVRAHHGAFGHGGHGGGHPAE